MNGMTAPLTDANGCRDVGWINSSIISVYLIKSKVHEAATFFFLNHSVQRLPIFIFSGGGGGAGVCFWFVCISMYAFLRWFINFIPFLCVCKIQFFPHLSAYYSITTSSCQCICLLSEFFPFLVYELYEYCVMPPQVLFCSNQQTDLAERQMGPTRLRCVYVSVCLFGVVCFFLTSPKAGVLSLL